MDDDYAVAARWAENATFDPADPTIERGAAAAASGQALLDSADVDYDEWVGQALRRGNRTWVAPPKTLLPNMFEEPAAPWVYLGEIEIEG